MKQNKIVEIEWKDITFYNGHYKINDSLDYTYKTFKTIGYLIEETKDYIKISFGIETTEEDTLMDFYVIPKGCIIKKRFIK